MKEVLENRVRSAKRRVVGGSQKRCRKGKSCSATCIQGIKVCLVSLSASVGSVISKVASLVGSKKPEPNYPEGAYLVRGKGQQRRILRRKTPLEKAFKGSFNKELLKQRIEEIRRQAPEVSAKEASKIALAQMKMNKAFVKNLSSNLPRNVKVFLWEGVIQLSTVTGSGDKILAQYSPKAGFHFSVNGSFDVGSVESRKGQIQVASVVRSLYDATVRSLPEGSVLRTRAYTEDEKGEKRTSIYNKLGFSKPESVGGPMFGVVGPNNSVSPSDQESWKSQSLLPESVFFSELQVFGYPPN